ncbi:MAG TPA: dTDP-4-dehydrorhamnose reductase [Pseudonocardiaceae bacterium]|jgi:dTDP-4-dehydrorhamnose reductase|nr:dTDP-4-dehydrorhamnose reductase [Pseudonocardiaceae bacterium]
MRSNKAGENHTNGRLALLVPGGRGQLGSDLARLGAAYGSVTAPGSAELDITAVASVTAAVDALVKSARADDSRPVVCNAAAYTAVDAAEDDTDRAEAINATGPALLAAVCASRGVPLLHVSTDYVFPGDARKPYEPDDPTGPRSVYGRTKLAGERAVLTGTDQSWVVRTAWVYGAAGSNFVRTMAKLGNTRPELSVVDDQRGSPTWSADLAGGLLELAGKAVEGSGPDHRVLHCTGGGETTWFGLAQAVFAELGMDPERVKPCTTADFPRPAPRPAYSVLADTTWRTAGLTPLRPWREALTEFVAQHRDQLV